MADRTGEFIALGGERDRSTAVAGGDARAAMLLKTVEDADALEGRLTDPDGASALRSLVAHKSSLLQRVTTHFNVTVLPNGKILMALSS